MASERSPVKQRLMLSVLILLVAMLSGCASSPGPDTGGKERATETAKPREVAPLTPAQNQLLSEAHSASKEERWEEASARLRQLIEERPEVAVTYSRLGWVVQQRGDTEAAMALYRKAIDRDPGDAMTVNNLALLLMQDEQFESAARLLREGLRYSPDVPELHYNLGVVSELYLLDLKTALRHYRRYRDLTGGEDKVVAGWIADLERRLD